MNDDVQKKYLEFQIIQQQMQQMQQQQSLVNNQIAQLSSLRDALESLSTTPANREILVPLGAGVFVKGS
ncbi:MAG: prefoldin subunit alpha, partial [Nanoarchaeota archaeon]|nr:prefoldin subunit alpha [Nanoarchaeota archaeon]